MGRRASASAARSSGARSLHVATVALLVAVGLGLDVDWLVLGSASLAVGGLLAYEHSLVRPGDLRRLDAAFFTMNGVISVAFFAFVFADVAVRDPRDEALPEALRP